MKGARLSKYKIGDGSHLVLFCDVEKLSVVDGIIVFPIRTAFQLFTSTESGRLWLKMRGRQFMTPIRGIAHWTCDDVRRSCTSGRLG
jgi:hypothetical protein